MSPFPIRPSPDACIFVASLNAFRTVPYLQKSVHQCFSKYGALISVKVFKDERARPYAFVQFVSADAATNALKCEIVLDGRFIRIEPAKVNRTLIMQCHADTLPEILSNFEIENVFDVSNVYTHRGYSLVKFNYREDAQQCLLQLKHSMWQVDWATNHHNKFQMLTILAVNLPMHYTQEKCQKYFNNYGECSTYVMNDYDPQYTGISCVVKYKHFSSVEQVLFQNLVIDDLPITCTLKCKLNDHFDETLEYPYFVHYPEYYYNSWYSSNGRKRQDSCAVEE